MLKFFLLFLPFILMAHQSGLSYIDIIEYSENKIQISYKKPLQDLYAPKIKINYPSYCKSKKISPQIIENGVIINNYIMQCSDNGLLNARVWIDGLLKKDKGVLIKYTNKNYSKKILLRADRPFVEFNQKESSFSLFISYVKLGIYHILSGYDHLLFVLCIIILSYNLKALFFAITAFTLSHSITLASAILGIVELSVVYIETMIALSIIFLARELVSYSNNTLTKKYLGIVAFIFGLLHGFGFSNVLKNIGLAEDEIPLSLFSFNLGIELGQIFFVVIVLSILFLLKYIFNPKLQNMQRFLGYSIGIIASFWFIQRLLILFK